MSHKTENSPRQRVHRGSQSELTKSLWECCTPEGKDKLKKLALSMGMFNFNPERPHREPKIKIEAKLEDLDEIESLMSMSPERFKDVKSE